MATSYYLYGIGASDGTTLKAVKYGISARPRKRLSTMQTSHHMCLTLLWAKRFVCKAHAEEEERVLHETNKPRRFRGEWFRPTGREQVAFKNRFLDGKRPTDGELNQLLRRVRRRK